MGRHNLRLKRAMKAAGHTSKSLGTAVGANSKTVQRWCYESRVPRRARAQRVAAELDVAIEWLWPTLMQRDSAFRQSGDLCQIFARADQLPTGLPTEMLIDAHTDLVLCSGDEWFLRHVTALPRGMLAEPVPTTLVARAIIPPDLYWLGVNAFGLGGVAEVRTHVAVDDLSIIRSDDTLLVINSGLGLATSASPAVLVHRRSDDGPFDSYASGLDCLWTEAHSKAGVDFY